MTWRTLILLQSHKFLLEQPISENCESFLALTNPSMVLFVNVMFEYESFDDWSWLRTGGGGGGGGRCGEPESSIPLLILLCLIHV